MMLPSICLQIWKTQQWPQDWKRSVFIAIPKKGNATECSYYCTIALISHVSKAMLNILQARVQQYVNWELSGVQAGFRKGRRIRDQIANITWIIEKKLENFRKTCTSSSLTKLKPLTVWITTNCGKFFRRWESQTPYLLPVKPLCKSKRTVWTGHGTKDWFKGVHQVCILPPCLFDLHAEYIMWNAWLDEAQARIKIARRSTNDLRYTDDTTFMAES